MTSDQRISDNEALLQEVARNTEVGKNALAQLLPMAQDREFRAQLLFQQKEYRRLNQQAHTALAACGARARGQSRMARAAVRMGIQAKARGDRSTRNLAQMLAEGANQGAMDVIKAQRDWPNASTGAKELAGELQRFEEESAQVLKGYL